MSNARFFVAAEGFEELMKEFDNMGKAGERAVNKALKEGGQVFKALTIAGAPRSNRNVATHLQDAIDVSRVKTDDAGEKYVSVGTYLGGGNYRGKVYWGHIVEGGHRIVTPSGKVVGWVAAKPFMQPAYEQGQDKAAKVMGDIIFNAMGLKK